MIALWIRYHCGKPSASSEDPNGQPLDPGNHDKLFKSGPANGWSSAASMRAAATYLYVCELGQTNTPYIQNYDGKWMGNPCNSQPVTMYMRSLKRQKVRLSYNTCLANSG